MAGRVVRIGLDFDGVVAYNPFRVVRSLVSYTKRNIFGIKELSFWYPKVFWQQIFWIILHESSVFPAKGIDLLREMIRSNSIEAHLVTARYSFLDDHLHAWLRRYHLKDLFTTISLNKNNEQPHIFKEKLIRRHNLHYYIEDNWDIVEHLNSRYPQKIYWIYNFMDKRLPYPRKFPHLKEALENIRQKIT